MTSLRRPPRERAIFCLSWFAIACWGFSAGAKVFDLVVVGASWSADVPASLARLPYGRGYPVNPGDFFQPLSVLLLIGSAGALIAGWRCAGRVRRLLWLPVLALAVIWILTPIVFWPIINGLYDAAHGKGSSSVAEVSRLSHRWFVWDWLRVVLISAGFITQACALMSFVTPSPRQAPGSRSREA